MLRHLLTALILCTALVLSALGLQTGFVVLLFASCLFEMWFWVRTLRSRPRQPKPARVSDAT